MDSNGNYLLEMRPFVTTHKISFYITHKYKITILMLVVFFFKLEVFTIAVAV